MERLGSVSEIFTFDISFDVKCAVKYAAFSSRLIYTILPVAGVPHTL
jgi:hypothetical protein